MIHAHQPGSPPIDIPEVIPNPAVVPRQEPAPKEPAPKNPVKEPEKVPAGEAAGLEVRCQPHMLRHLCGSALANKGVDTRTIQSLLGHRRSRRVRLPRARAGSLNGIC